MAVVAKRSFRSLLSQATARTSPLSPLASSLLLSPSCAVRFDTSNPAEFPPLLPLLFSMALSYPSSKRKYRLSIMRCCNQHAVNWRKLLLLLLLLPLRQFRFQLAQNYENSAGKQETRYHFTDCCEGSVQIQALSLNTAAEIGGATNRH